MSTRCQVIVKDSYGEVWFYRHCDGYPEGVKPTLDQFCQWIKDKRIRNNAEQAAGWLVILGREEYKKWEDGRQDGPWEPGHEDALSGWEVGAYEPCSPQMHGDIEFLHVVDVDAAEWQSVEFDTSKNIWEYPKATA